jgi:hypothetical protein
LEEKPFNIGLLNVFFDIQTRIVNGFNDDRAFCFGYKPSAGAQDMILMLARAGHPNHTVLAFNRHSVLAVIQVEYLVRVEEQLDPWGL